MRAALLAATCLAAIGCGTSSKQAPPADGGGCVAIGAEAFCSASAPCCAGGYCDPVSTRCRDGSRCGVRSEGCDAAHACCDGLTCFSGTCSGDTGPSTTGGSGSGSASTTTTGGCHGLAQSCSVDGDCCSGHCASGNHLCAASTSSTTGTGSTSTTTGSTTGGTCSSAGTGCSSSTECCSHTCSGGVCG